MAISTVLHIKRDPSRVRLDRDATASEASSAGRSDRPGNIPVSAPVGQTSVSAENTGRSVGLPVRELQHSVSTDAERLAVLEAKLAQAEVERKANAEKLERIHVQVEAINVKLATYRSFWGGVIFAASAAAGAVGALAAALWGHIKP